MPPSAVRRHDIDWLRIVALGLLIVYHVVIAFQPWSEAIFFIRNDQPLEILWPLMGMFNVWRIPILFMVSGMGVCFAMRRRDWKALLKDRTLRILVPLVFGTFCICPISLFLAMEFYDNFPFQSSAYVPNPGHLWFLANIFLYVVLLLPLLSYLHNHPKNPVVRFLSSSFRHPAGLFLLTIPLMLEAILVQPEFFVLYVGSAHGFWLGMVCFLTGFLLIFTSEVFWHTVERTRIFVLCLAFLLYLVRLLLFELEGPIVLTAFESMTWMLTVLGYGSKYLNTPSQILKYLSKAVYPVYIIHMPLQFFFAYYLMPLPMVAPLKVVMLLGTTLGTSFLFYEFILRRLKWIRPLFGMSLTPNTKSVTSR